MSYGFNNDKSKFPLGVASDLPDPTKTPMKIIGELQNQIIDSASIENGATASKAYASGDYICFQGALCKASKAISQGDTLSIGDSANDNLTLTDAAAEFARINSKLSDMLNFTFNLTHTTGSITGNSDSSTLIPYQTGFNQQNVIGVNVLYINPNANENTQAYLRSVTIESAGIRLSLHTSGTTTQSYVIHYNLISK